MFLELPKILETRAQMLGLCRNFFHRRNVLEVDCCSIVKKAPIDANIDVIDIHVTKSTKAFLHTSPEVAMKKLLCQGMKDIFFLGHVFRQGEIGKKHSPEFTMAEWYRIGISFEEMIQETLDFLSLFLGKQPIEILSYRKAFETFARVNYSKDDLSHLLPNDCKNWSRQEQIHYILSQRVEPHLGKTGFTVIKDFPPQEAALACITVNNDEEVASRFEIYYQGVELANGYHELSDGDELLRRFEKENQARISRNDDPYTIDQEFLQMIRDLPPCCGVSVGFDRALMLHLKADSIQQVLPNCW